MYFRFMDQSDPEIQRKMLAARQYVFANSDFVDKSFSPSVVWLEAFQDFVRQAQPVALRNNAVVTNFTELLDSFLTQQV